MASPVFYITQPMLDVLTACRTKKKIGRKLERAFYVLHRRGMVKGSVWDKPSVTQLGLRTLSLVCEAQKAETKTDRLY